jgi:DNA-binding CsgD family transcriptional regulator
MGVDGKVGLGRQMQNDVVLSLIDEIYAAALDPNGWQQVLKLFAHSLSSEVGTLFQQDVRASDINFVLQEGVPEDFYDAYFRHYFGLNVWQPHMAELPMGATSNDAAVMPVRELKRKEFYSDWLRPQGLVHTMGANLLSDQRGTTEIAVLRSARRGHYSASEQILLKQLVPHFQRAVQVQRSLFLARMQAQSGGQALSASGIGMIIVAEDARVLSCNDVAERIVSAGCGITIRGTRLCAQTSAATELLRVTIAEAARAGVRSGRGSGGVLALPAGLENRMPVLIAPLKAENDLFRFHRPAAVVFISGKERSSRLAAADIEQVFGLTPAEARIVCGLLEGLSLNEYALKARVSVATVRTQLKQVFAKTGATSQSILMRLILADPIFAISAARQE